MKKISAILCLILVFSLLSGCAGSPVIYYSDCTCPADSHVQSPVTQPEETQVPVVSEGAVKTGLAIVTSAGDSVNGEVKYDVTVAAVNVDDNGVITACYIDSIGASVKFGADGVITSETAAVATKNELGDNYGMKAYGNATYEWYEQAAALADYAVGKTVEELRSGAVNESGKAADADLATTATIYLGGYVAAIEKAVANAQHLGAQAGDELKVAVLASLADSKSVEGENMGNAQLNVDVTAITMSGDVITSCALDAVQAKVPFYAGGIEGIPTEFPTKNELGEAYGMKAWAGAKYEWNEQAANFAAYVTGKTVAEVQGIAIDEATKPTDADLSTSVTISIGGFQALIEKAAGVASMDDSLKTGLSIVTTAALDITKSGCHFDYYAAIVTVLVDAEGVIQDCTIDTLRDTLSYDGSGSAGRDLDWPLPTWNELADRNEADYLEKQRGWVAALADFAIGKTVEELRAAAVAEAENVTDSDLSRSADCYLEIYLNAFEKASSNAQNLGAKTGDQLKMAVNASFADSTEILYEEDGYAQLNLDVAAITMNGDVITSCVLDAVQAKVYHEEAEVGDTFTDFPTKNELGEAYGMKAWGGATFEWNEQAANFAAYVIGKTVAEVQGIAIDETTKPVDADLSTSVTISIGGFQALIAKAAQ